MSNLRLMTVKTVDVPRLPGSERLPVHPLDKHLFVRLTSLALDVTEFFRIPVNRIVELGGQIEI